MGAMRRVLEWGQQRRSFVRVEEGATKGAKVGENLYNEDGTLFDPEVIVTEIVNENIPSTPGYGSIASTIWRLILEIPANIVSLAALTGVGFATRLNASSEWANRVITGAVGRITVQSGDGNGTVQSVTLNSGDAVTLNSGGDVTLNALTDGNPLIDLAVLADTGVGSLLAITRDDWGRVSGTRAIDYYDIPQWPVIKEILDADFTIREDYQLIVYDSFDVEETLNIEGTLVIL